MQAVLALSGQKLLNHAKQLTARETEEKINHGRRDEKGYSLVRNLSPTLVSCLSLSSLVFVSKLLCLSACDKQQLFHALHLSSRVRDLAAS